jgi:hypothetical protein
VAVPTPLPEDQRLGATSENVAEPVTRPDSLDDARTDEGTSASPPDTDARLDRLLRSFLR